LLTTRKREEYWFGVAPKEAEKLEAEEQNRRFTSLSRAAALHSVQLAANTFAQLSPFALLCSL